MAGGPDTRGACFGAKEEGVDMRTVLIAKENLESGTARVKLLSAAGYNVITCPGPWPPERCIRRDVGYCPLTEGADLMIYDPKLVGRDHAGRTYNLAIDSGLAHPDVPLVLETDEAAARIEAVPGAEIAERETSAFLAQVRRLLESTPT
jgi:hypothetical protein